MPRCSFTLAYSPSTQSKNDWRSVPPRGIKLPGRLRSEYFTRDDTPVAFVSRRLRDWDGPSPADIAHNNLQKKRRRVSRSGLQPSSKAWYYYKL